MKGVKVTQGVMDPIELGWQAVVKCLTWVLGTESVLSRSTISVLTHELSLWSLPILESF